MSAANITGDPERPGREAVELPVQESERYAEHRGAGGRTAACPGISAF